MPEVDFGQMVPASMIETSYIQVARVPKLIQLEVRDGCHRKRAWREVWKLRACLSAKVFHWNVQCSVTFTVKPPGLVDDWRLGLQLAGAHSVDDWRDAGASAGA